MMPDDIWSCDYDQYGYCYNGSYGQTEYDNDGYVYDNIVYDYDYSGYDYDCT